MSAPDPMLAVDAGNTRIKWGLRGASGWLATGAVATGDHASLRSQWDGAGVKPAAAIVSNVAGDAVADGIAAVLRDLAIPVRWHAASSACAGVTNRYELPERLGPDRWAALIGARARCQAGCVVANCGTATTIDALSPDGEFLGGVIAAGVDLMRDALAARVPALQFPRGRFAMFPGNTADAIASGAIYAVAGAVVGVAGRLAQWSGEEPRIVLTGGAAAAVLPQLAGNIDIVEHLVLEGLVVAMSSA